MCAGGWGKGVKKRLLSMGLEKLAKSRSVRSISGVIWMAVMHISGVIWMV